MEIRFSLGKCKTRAGYSARLLQKGKLNLKTLKPQFTLLLEAPILLVIREQGLEIVVHQYGELLFRNGKAEDVVLMEKVARRIYEAGLES